MAGWLFIRWFFCGTALDSAVLYCVVGGCSGESARVNRMPRGGEVRGSTALERRKARGSRNGTKFALSANEEDWKRSRFLFREAQDMSEVAAHFDISSRIMSHDTRTRSHVSVRVCAHFCGYGKSGSVPRSYVPGSETGISPACRN